MSASEEIPPGTMMLWAGGAGWRRDDVLGVFPIPAPGWLYCDGGVVPQSTYPALYAVIGSKYGSASAGYFKLPGYYSASAMGTAGYQHIVKSTTTSSNSEQSFVSSNSHTHTISASGISITSVSNASDHSSAHNTISANTTDGTGDHTHNVTGARGAGATVFRGDGTYIGIGSHTHDSYSNDTITTSTGANHSITITAATDNATHTHTNVSLATNPLTNSGNQSFVQPTIELWYIIKI